MQKTDLPYYVTNFFAIYLPGQKNLSKNTIASYAATFKLFFTFCKDRKNILPERLKLSMLNEPLITEFLDWLGTQGIGTGVVSNLSFCGETLRRRIEGCLPGASFAFVISSCDYLFRKPSPHIFEAALAKAGVPAEDVWFCGDQFIPDLEGAAAAGMTPVWYRAFLRYDQECALKTGLQVDSWEELRGIIEALEP